MADEVLNLVLPLYRNDNPDIALDTYTKHLEQISKALSTSSDEKRTRLQNGLKSAYFIKTVNAADSSLEGWKQPIREQVFLRTSSLNTWFESNSSVWFVDEAATQNSSWNDIELHLSLSSYVPVGGQSLYKLSTHGWHRRGLNKFNPDATVIGIEHVISHINTSRAKILWDLLLANIHLVKGVVETATRQGFSNAKREYLWSKFGETCRDSQWMPDGSGVFHKPEELFLTDLPQEFEKDSATAKILAATLGMKKPELQELAEKLGLAAQDIEIIQQNRKSFDRWLQGQNKSKTETVQLPVQPPAAPSQSQDSSEGVKHPDSFASASNTSNKNGGSDSPRTRLLSYVLPKSEAITVDNKANVTGDNKEAVNRAGVDYVLAWETQAGRYPSEMSHTHPGYDVESKNETDEVMRYIEVKSRTGIWDQQGVTLSDTQFHEAQKRGNSYWLYIVENADQEDAQLFRIQNPANHVEYFCFDSGWRGLSEENLTIKT